MLRIVLTLTVFTTWLVHAASLPAYDCADIQVHGDWVEIETFTTRYGTLLFFPGQDFRGISVTLAVGGSEKSTFLRSRQDLCVTSSRWYKFEVTVRHTKSTQLCEFRIGSCSGRCGQITDYATWYTLTFEEFESVSIVAHGASFWALRNFRPEQCKNPVALDAKPTAPPTTTTAPPTTTTAPSTTTIAAHNTGEAGRNETAVTLIITPSEDVPLLTWVAGIGGGAVVLVVVVPLAFIAARRLQLLGSGRQQSQTVDPVSRPQPAGGCDNGVHESIDEIQDTERHRMAAAGTVLWRREKVCSLCTSDSVPPYPAPPSPGHHDSTHNRESPLYMEIN